MLLCNLKERNITLYLSVTTQVVRFKVHCSAPPLAAEAASLIEEETS